MDAIRGKAVQPEVPLKGLEIWALEWKDAHYNDGEFDRSEIIHRAVNFVTVGILLIDDAEGITVAMDVCENGTFRGINFVPAEMVVAKWKVGDLKKRKTSKRKPEASASTL